MKNKKNNKNTKNKYGDNIRHYFNQGPNYDIVRHETYINRFNFYNPRNLGIPEIIRIGFETVIKDNDDVHNLTLCIEYSLENQTFEQASNNETLKSIYISRSNVNVNSEESKSKTEIKKGQPLIDNLDKGFGKMYDSEYSREIKNVFKEKIFKDRTKTALEKLKAYMLDKYPEHIDVIDVPENYENVHRYKISHQEILTHLYVFLNNKGVDRDIISEIKDYYIKEYKATKDPESIWSQKSGYAEKFMYKNMEKHPMNQIENVIRDLTKPNVTVFKIYLGERYKAYTFIPVQILFIDLKARTRNELKFNRNGRYSLRDKFLLLDPYQGEAEARKQIFNRRKTIRKHLVSESTSEERDRRISERERIRTSPRYQRFLNRQPIQTLTTSSDVQRYTSRNEPDDYKLLRLNEEIVPEIEDKIIEYLDQRVTESKKLLDKFLNKSKEQILREGYTPEQNEESIKNLESKIEKLKQEVLTKNYSLQTITSVFHPMIKNQWAVPYVTVDQLIQEYRNQESESELEEEPETFSGDFPIQKNTELAPPEGELCSICFDSLDETQRLCKLQFCGHWFHCGCISDYKRSTGKVECPVCREFMGGIQSNTFGKKRRELKYLRLL
jgi:hypothetical protein